jgi:PAS domain S-box-containing protein
VPVTLTAPAPAPRLGAAPRELERQIEAVGPGDHLCLVYEEPAEQLAAIAPFVRIGLERGEQCLYIVDDRTAAEVAAALAAAGIDVGAARGRGALVLATKRETYLRDGSFDPATMLEFLRGALGATLARGYSALRITGEMTWALGPEVGCDRLLEYEAGLNAFFPGSKALAICQYNRRRFSPAVIRDVLRTHPVAILGEQVCPNLYYEPPGFALDPTADDQRVDWMIRQLRRAREADLRQEETAAERERLTGELRYQLAVTKTITDNAASCLCTMDARGYPTFVNPAFERVTGYTLDEIGGRPLHYAVHHKYPDGRPYPMEECPIDRAYPVMAPVPYGEEVFVRKDGSLFPVAFAVAPLERDGVNVGAVLEFRDITEQKRAEQALREEQERTRRALREAEEAVRLRDDFLSIAAHELKTPATSLLGYSQVTLRRLERDGAPDPQRLRRALAVIDQQTTKLAKLIDQLLDVSRLEGGRLVLDRRPADLAALVRAAAEDATSRGARHRIAVHAPPGPLAAGVDALRIEQVLANLLDNAIKYSPDGGDIDVHLEQEGTVARIAVRDRGLGVPPERRPHIFDRFYRAHAESHHSGMGLGLFICKEIVELHAGTIAAEFPNDGGTRIVVTLPLDAPAAGPGEPRHR